MIKEQHPAAVMLFLAFDRISGSFDSKSPQELLRPILCYFGILWLTLPIEMIISTPIIIWKVIPIIETKMQIIETVSERVHLTPVSVDSVSFSDQQWAPKPSFHSHFSIPVQAADWQSLAWCHSLRTRFPWSTKRARFRICWLTVKTLNDLLNFRTMSDGSVGGQPTGLKAKSWSAVGNSRIFSCIFFANTPNARF